jgi:predicted methyltransferase
MQFRHAIAAVTLFAAAPAFAAMDAATEAKLKTNIAGAQRSDADKARDAHRHPLETLKFFGLRSDMAVMEIWPSGGYWTSFLAPTLAEKGRYVAAGYDPEHKEPYYAKGAAAFKDKYKDTATYGKVEIGVLMPETGKVEPVKPGSMDMVLTFRNVHNWMNDGSDKVMVDAMYKALKPGGHLGVEEHRASASAPQDPKAKSGYVREDHAIKMFEAAGFKLVGKSEVNANPKDTKDYPKGVWTLPPNFIEKDKDKEKYAAIGESDRFTLLFQKPAS